MDSLNEWFLPWSRGGQLTMRADGVKVVEYVGTRSRDVMFATAAPRGKPTISLATDRAGAKESAQIDAQDSSCTPTEGRNLRRVNPSAATESTPLSWLGGPTAITVGPAPEMAAGTPAARSRCMSS